MKKRITALFLLLFVLQNISAVCAAPDPFAHFTKPVKYHPGMYTDVAENAWYGTEHRGVIRDAAELGLMNGMGDGTFRPDKELRICEAVKIACVLHDIYHGGDGIWEISEPWYRIYMEEAVKRRIIGENEFASPEEPATQLQTAVIFSRALPEAGLEAINWIGSIDGVHTSRMFAIENADSVFTLYRAGVMTGDGAGRQFSPYARITRAEAAELAVRMADPQKRQRFDILTNTGDAQQYMEYGVVSENGAPLTLGQQPRSVLTDVFGSINPRESRHEWLGMRGETGYTVRAYYGETEIAYIIPSDDRDVIYVYAISMTGECGLSRNGLSVGDDEEKIRRVHSEEEYSFRTHIGDTSYWGNPNDHQYVFEIGPGPAYCQQLYQTLHGKITEIHIHCSIN